MTVAAICAIGAGKMGHNTTVIMPIIIPARMRRCRLGGMS